MFEEKKKQQPSEVLPLERIELEEGGVCAEITFLARFIQL